MVALRRGGPKHGLDVPVLVAAGAESHLCALLGHACAALRRRRRFRRLQAAATSIGLAAFRRKPAHLGFPFAPADRHDGDGGLAALVGADGVDGILKVVQHSAVAQVNLYALDVDGARARHAMREFRQPA